VRQKSLFLICHSGLDPESSLSKLDSRFRGNDDYGINIKKSKTHYTRVTKPVSSTGYGEVERIKRR
jgi:hypothetical protein